MRRRTFLTGSSTVLAAGIGGCTMLADDEREDVVLTHIELGNATDEAQTFDVLVSYDSDIIYWAAHDVEPSQEEQEMGGEVIEIDPPDDPGHVEVHVRVGDTWRSIDFETDDAEYDGERVTVIATYGMVEDDLLRLSRTRSDRSVSSTD